ncbi:MAG: aldehyde reductase [Crocinitomicaceae bacterium]
MAADKSLPIVVTGASGYIASWIVKFLLEDGYLVRGTVRSTKAFAKIAHLVKLQETFPGKLELFEADLMQEGSFDQAVKGAQIVIHTASPFFITKIKDAQKQLIEPAQQGTKNVLESVERSGTVERVVLTSSCAAIYGDNIDVEMVEGGVFNEKIWNTSSSLSHNPYSYSKTIAEKTAWEMQKNSGKWTLTTINPGFVMGPSLSDRTDGTSVSYMIQLLDGKLKSGVPDLHFAVVDVRDVAKAHILAAENYRASGRHICVSDHKTFLEFGLILKKHFPKYKLPTKVAPKWLLYIMGPMMGIGWKFLRKNIGYRLNFDNSYIKEDLGIQFRPFEETLVEHAQQLIQSGLVQKK